MGRGLTTVVNCRRERCDVKITRLKDGSIPDPPKPGCYGNPYNLSQFSREESLGLFETYFLNRVRTDEAFRQAVLALKGLTIGCVCKPLACHGDIIKKWLDDQPED